MPYMQSTIKWNAVKQDVPVNKILEKAYDSDRKKASDCPEAGWGELKEHQAKSRGYKETFESEALF